MRQRLDPGIQDDEGFERGMRHGAAAFRSFSCNLGAARSQDGVGLHAAPRHSSQPQYRTDTMKPIHPGCLAATLVLGIAPLAAENLSLHPELAVAASKVDTARWTPPAPSSKWTSSRRTSKCSCRTPI